MKIKLTRSRNIKGKRINKDTILLVGHDIDEWQSKILLDLDQATECDDKSEKGKKGKSGSCSKK